MQEVPEELSVLHQLQTLSLSSNEICVLPTLIVPSLHKKGDTVEDKHVEQEDGDGDVMDTTTQEEDVGEGVEEQQQTSFFQQ